VAGIRTDIIPTETVANTSSTKPQSNVSSPKLGAIYHISYAVSCCLLPRMRPVDCWAAEAFRPICPCASKKTIASATKSDSQTNQLMKKQGGR
jgi:hypothetical protein